VPAHRRSPRPPAPWDPVRPPGTSRHRGRRRPLAQARQRAALAEGGDITGRDHGASMNGSVRAARAVPPGPRPVLIAAPTRTIEPFRVRVRRAHRGGMSMRDRLPGPLRLSSRPEPHPAEVDQPPVGAPSVPVVELTVYADDSVAFGHVALTAHRVTDLMNESTSSSSWTRSSRASTTVTGWCADGQRSRGTRSSPSRSPVHGAIRRAVRGPGRSRSSCGSVGTTSAGIPHRAGHGPDHRVSTPAVMVPLTEATIEFDSADGRRISRFGTILVNRDRTNWIGPATRSDIRPRISSPSATGWASRRTSLA